MLEIDYDKWFENIYMSYLPKMLKLATRRLRDVDLAQEIIHDTFLIAWKERQRVIQHPNIEGFLMKTMGNNIVHVLRHMKYENNVPYQFVADLRTVDQYSFECAIIFPDGLSKSEKDLLIWHFIQKIPYTSIAAKLGISEGNCRVRVFRAKQHYIALTKSNRESN